MLRNDTDCGDAEFELEVLHELSQARTNPSGIAQALHERLSHFKGNDYFPPDRGGKTAVVTKEGQVAVRDAITYLERAGRLPPLAEACTQGLRLGAEDHLLDLAQRGAVGHQGADGSTSSERMNRYGAWSGKCGECLWFGRMGTSAKQVVEDLIIDDGVPTRGHRLGIYDQAFQVAGVRMGQHKTFGACCVMDFASCYQDSEDRLIARVVDGPPVVAAGGPVKTQWKLGECPGCKEAIHGGAVMEAMGHKWHADCFACQAQSCGKSLRGVGYQEHAGMPFCNDCYYSQFGSTCDGCGKKIHGGVMKALGQTWHKECFVCGTCKGPLEARYATRDGKAVCGGCSSAPGKAGSIPLRPSLAARKAGSMVVGGPMPKTPPPASGRTPPPKAGGVGGRAPLAKAGALPKIGAGRSSVAKATPKSVGTAKRVVESLVMDYADLC